MLGYMPHVPSIGHLGSVANNPGNRHVGRVKKIERIPAYAVNSNKLAMNRFCL
jgi:hypothetical protein